MDMLRFYLNGTPREIDFPPQQPPFLFCFTLPAHAKNLPNKGNVRCRGDCGACTVILACKDIVSGREKRFSADSCLMRFPIARETSFYH